MTIKRVTPEEAQRMVQDDGYVYLDVRSVPEFAAGHPEGAYNIPFLKMTPAGMKPNLSFVDDVKDRFAADDKLVVGCRSGGRSAQAATALSGAGYGTIADVAGGFDAWIPSGQPVSTEAPGRTYEELKASK